MKIAIIVPLFPPKWLAGTEIAAYNIAYSLHKRGHDVHVITSLDSDIDEKSLNDTFYIHRVKNNYLSSNTQSNKVTFRTALNSTLFWLKIFFELKKIYPDIIHIQSMWISIPGYLARKILKIPYIVYARGSDVYFPTKLITLTSGFTLKNSSALIGLTTDMKKKLSNIYDGDIYVIPNGIDLDRFGVHSVNKTHSANKKTILFVGRLAPIKGVSNLIEAMDIITKTNRNIRLLIVGEGEDKEKLEYLVNKLNLNDYIFFCGRILNMDIPKYMDIADIFVLPSLSEGFPNVILEAMAAGVPVIATNVGGISEIVQNGINGLLVEPNNSEMIAQSTLFLLNNESLMQSISRNNIVNVKEYDWEKITSKLEDIYLYCANKN